MVFHDHLNGENRRGGPGRLTMVNQIEFYPSRLSHFTLPEERAKSTEKFRASPRAAQRREDLHRVFAVHDFWPRILNF